MEYLPVRLPWFQYQIWCTWMGRGAAGCVFHNLLCLPLYVAPEGNKDITNNNSSNINKKMEASLKDVYFNKQLPEANLDCLFGCFSFSFSIATIVFKDTTATTALRKDIFISHPTCQGLSPFVPMFIWFLWVVLEIDASKGSLEWINVASCSNRAPRGRQLCIFYNVDNIGVLVIVLGSF